MTDKAIKALASEYTDELFQDDDLSDIENEEEKNDCLVICQSFLNFILEKHEVISKEKLREAISNIRDAYDNGDNDMVEAYLEDLESLFPTIESKE